MTQSQPEASVFTLVQPKTIVPVIHRVDTCNFNNGGVALIQWPDNMGEEDFDDFSEWLRLVEKKIGRICRKKANSVSNDLREGST